MPNDDQPNSLPVKKQRGTWVQTERAAHEAWAMFLGLPGSLNASRVLHLLIARVEDHNAVVMSQPALVQFRCRLHHPICDWQRLQFQ